jgi:RNA polymerase sigma-70 factor (ECF subfamily)
MIADLMLSDTSWTSSREAFQQLAEAYRYQLQVHCYRMLGSLHEAEDLVQDTFLRAWRGREGFQGRTSFRNWLYRIATNACLNALATRSLRARTEASPGRLAAEPATDVTWLEPYPNAALDEVADMEPGPDARYELRESVQLAFIAAIQQLPARQRAVLLLRDVLGWSAAETAQLMDASVASVNSALQRARATLGRHAARSRSGAPTATDAAQQDLLERYVRTWEAADIDGFVALLKQDAILSMPPRREWYRGRDAIRSFLLAARHPRPAGGSRVLLIAANGQPAVAHYVRAADGSRFDAHNISVLTVEGDGIIALTAFPNPELFPKFGLPTTLPLGAPRA